ncbi:MAG TPA: hypothetical protein VN704_08800 [Verrucomicrobiae bacterium]|nr:hypothetical protein [Verrucomicrobiae bacterium]
MTDSNEYKKIDWKDNTIEWKDLIKKEARGYEKGDDLGEVQEIGKEFVVTERGRVSKHKFYLPKQLVTGFDGHTLWFHITEEDAEDNFKKDYPPKEGEYSRYQVASSTEQINNSAGDSSPDITNYSLFDRIPLMEKQNRFDNRNIPETTTNSIIADWDSIIHKGVRSKEMIAIGSVTAVNPTSIIITSDGAKDEYSIPKDEVDGYNGSELLLKPTLDRLEQYKVKVPR